MVSYEGRITVYVHKITCTSTHVKGNAYTIIIHWKLKCLVMHHCSRRDLWWGLEFIST